MAPIARALAQRGLPPRIVLTGQQALDPDDFSLGKFPLEQLQCPGEQEPHRHVHAVTTALLATLDPRPKLLIVQGDTSSALGAAVAGFRSGVPVAHVEAGLRTFDPRLPWPEEEYRTAIDAEADLLFAPTALAARNLRLECVAGAVHVTGNSGIDALLEVAASLPCPEPRERGRPRLLVTCHRRESWDRGLRNIARALSVLARARAADIEMVLHPNAHVAATVRQTLKHAPHVRLIEPLCHRELVHRMRDADLILSDSGGIQEEAPALGTPLLVLRDKTERPEGIASGNMVLVGTATERIVGEVRRLLADPAALARMSRPAFPYGDGRAAPRIAAIVDDWLEQAARRRVANAPTSPGRAARW